MQKISRGSQEIIENVAKGWKSLLEIASLILIRDLSKV